MLLLLSRRRTYYIGYRESDAGSRRYFGSWYLSGQFGVVSLRRLSRGRYGTWYVFPLVLEAKHASTTNGTPKGRKRKVAGVSINEYDYEEPSPKHITLNVRTVTTTMLRVPSRSMTWSFSLNKLTLRTIASS